MENDVEQVEREPPRNCQHEPPYPGHRTVVCTLRDPELVAHRASPECAREAPHPVAECGEFLPPPVDADYVRYLAACAHSALARVRMPPPPPHSPVPREVKHEQQER